MVFKTARHALDILCEGRFVSSGLPWLRQHGVPLPMSLPAFKFDRYKRARLKAVPRCDLSGFKDCLVSQGAPTPGLVSVVLPVHNGEKYLRQALDSLSSQTYPAWELIAVDDGSTDDSGTILDEFAARENEKKAQGNGKGRRIYVIHQSNQKLPAALNEGFRHAQGDFFSWISDDNILYPNFLLSLVDCLQRHPDWDVVFANEDVIGEDGELLLNAAWFRGYQRPLGSPHIHLPKDTSELNTLDNNTISAAFLYRRRVRELIGEYDTRRFSTEDYDYWMRVNALLTLRHADFQEPLLAYRFHGSSLTSRSAELGIRQACADLLRFDDFRRDSYLAPLIWRVYGDGTEPAERFLLDLHRQNVLVGNELLPKNIKDGVETSSLPSLWFPSITIWIASTADSTVEKMVSKPQDLLPGDLTLGLVVKDSSLHLYVLDPQTDRFTPFGDLTSVATLVTVADLLARRRVLDGVQAEINAPTQPRYRLSVVICTYRRGDQLEQAVASVAGQYLSPSSYEVLVVNNAPEDTSLPGRMANLQARYFADRPERFRLVECPHLGLSYARNAGFAEAQGEIVCYLDDDAVAEPDWLELILQAFDQHPQVGIVGGVVLLRKPDRLPRWWRNGFEIYWSGFTPSYPAFKLVDHWSQYPVGANWCARRRVLLDIGGFRSRYGRRGSSYQGAEEIVAAEMARKAGYQVGVEPHAKVTHYVDNSRFKLRHLFGILLGGRQGWYKAQMDLYLPWELGLRNALYRIGRAFWPPSLRSLARTLYMLAVETWTFIWYLLDLLRRFRKPAVLR